MTNHAKGCAVSSFTKSADQPKSEAKTKPALHEAGHTIAAHEITCLQAVDLDAFFTAIDAPAEPGAALVRAAERYLSRVTSRSLLEMAERWKTGPHQDNEAKPEGTGNNAIL